MLRFSPALRLCVLSLFVFVLSACGGGGGGGGSTGFTSDGSSTTPPASTAADSPNAYLPTDPGIKWTYNDATQIGFLPDDTSMGMHVHALLYPTGGEEYFVTATDQINLEGLYLPYISVGDGVIYTGDIRFDNLITVLRSDWATDGGFTVSGSGTIDISPTYGMHSVTFSGTIDYVSDESVSTALGSFITKRVNIHLTLTATVEGRTFSVPYDVTFWFSKNAGIVERVQGEQSYLLTSVDGLDLTSAVNTDTSSSAGTGASSTDTSGTGTGTGSTDTSGTGTGSTDTSGTGTGGASSGNTGAGGTSSSGSGSGDNTAQAASISANLTSLSFISHLGGGSPASQEVALTYEGDTVVVDSWPYWLKLTASVSPSTNVVAYSIVPTATYFGVGTYRDTIRFKSIRTQSGSYAYIDIPVTLVVSNFTLSVPSVDLTAVDGSASVQQDASARTFSISGTALSWSLSSDKSWLTFDQTAGEGAANVSFNVNSSALGLGVHTANISVTNANTGEILILPVTVTVNAPQLVLSPQALTFSVDGQTTNAQLSQIATVTDELGSADVLRGVSWHIESINAPWVASVSPSSGNSSSATQFTVTLDTSELSVLADGDHSGSVTIGYTTEDMQTHTMTMPLSLHMSMPRVQWVAPHVVYAGQQFEIILRGSGFSSAAGLPVYFGSDAVSDVARVSDTEIRVTYPALPAGETPVRVSNSLGLEIGAARLVVKDASPLPAATLSSSNQIDKVLFDNERQILYGIASQAQEIDRVALQNGVWSYLPPIPVDSVQDAALSTDGATLVIVSGNSVVNGSGIYELDLAGHSEVPVKLLGHDGYLSHVAVTNHNLAIVTSLDGDSYRYVVGSGSFIPNPHPQGWFFLPQISASEDGRRVVILQNGQTPPVSEFNASVDALNTTTADGYSHPALSRNAEKLLLGTFVYDREYRFLGYIGRSNYYSDGYSSRISPDGGRAFVYEFDNLLTPQDIAVYDLTKSPGSDGHFPILKTIPVSPTLSNKNMVQIAISGDGLTMFLWGDGGLQVIPLE